MTLGLKRLGIKKQQNERRGGGKRRDTALRRPSNAAAANVESHVTRARSTEVIEESGGGESNPSRKLPNLRWLHI